MITTKSINVISFILIIASLVACKGDMDVNEMVNEINGYAGVSEELWPYFERFEEEAASRGVSVDLKSLRITGQIAEIHSEGVAGVCSYSSSNPSNVRVDQSFWRSASSLFKEFIVFHELGHCAFGRDHREGSNTNGFCLSLMRSGSGSCRDNYSFSTRNAYLDELFDTRFFNQLGF